MVVKVAINGFGRIGRLVLKSGYKDNNIDFAAVNSSGDPKTLAHLLKYDSVHGILADEVKPGSNSFFLGGKEIKTFSEKDPSQLPWEKLGIDVVVESTGVFRTYEQAEAHLKAGAKKVIITAPAKGETTVKSIVMGVNENIYNHQQDKIISNASCTTNCVVPMAKILHQNFTIQKGYMTTIHSYTSDQKLLDKRHRDFRRSRSAALSIIPTSTGAAKLIGVIFPELKGKIDGISIRVPTPDVSLVDLVCEVAKETTKEEVNQVFRQAAQGPMNKYLEYSSEPLVSRDFVGNSHSAIFDSELTAVINKTLIKTYGWYDNEWGYACRVVDLINYIGQWL